MRNVLAKLIRSVRMVNFLEKSPFVDVLVGVRTEAKPCGLGQAEVRSKIQFDPVGRCMKLA
jgi:hypothetical protein